MRRTIVLVALLAVGSLTLAVAAFQQPPALGDFFVQRNIIDFKEGLVGKIGDIGGAPSPAPHL